MMKCIVNVSCGGWFPKGQDRLTNSLIKYAPDIHRVFYRDVFPSDCPSHAEHPYAFKPFAIKEAYSLGYDIVLWADASIYAIDNIELVLEFIEEHGYLFFANSYIGYFSSDRCLQHFGISREEAFSMREIMGCCFGLNLKNETTRKFLDLLYSKSTDGETFVGPWNNDNKEASIDDRVKGHRHDQTVASLIAHQLCMTNFIEPHKTFMCYKSQISYYYPNNDIPSTICLLNEGM